MTIAHVIKCLRLFAVSFVFFQVFECSGSPLKSDEDIFFFPTSANQIENGKWNVPVHHWVFEKEESSISRKFSQYLLSEAIETLGVSEEQAHSSTFKQRLMWFLVDNERNKEIDISLHETKQTLSLTEANGHAHSAMVLEKIPEAKKGAWLSYQVNVPEDEKRTFQGKVQLIPKTGLSVISDIDDTIKVSNVLDKKGLIKNTFVKPFEATEGFPDYYAKLQKQGAYFHYVSASPWQIYPSLKPFMDKHYPQGTVYLRKFRLKDSSLLDFLKPSVEYKTKQIQHIIQRYPKHQFILMGDSGEHDPEVYADIYQQFPKKIQAIKIRAVKGSDLSTERFSKTFNQVPKSIWELFEKPELKKELNKGLINVDSPED